MQFLQQAAEQTEASRKEEEAKNAEEKLRAEEEVTVLRSRPQLELAVNLLENLARVWKCLLVLAVRHTP